jgi:hypothetical protein
VSQQFFDLSIIIEIWSAIYQATTRAHVYGAGRAGPTIDGAGAHAGACGLVRGLVQRQGSCGGGGAGVGRLVGCLARLNQWLAGLGVEPTGPSP